MGDRTKIPWADATYNPIAGCSDDPISPGCENCYAKTMAYRMGGPGQHFEGLADKKGWTGKVEFYPNMLNKPLHWEKPRVIFVCSMGDLFFSNVCHELIDQVFGVIATCFLRERRHQFLILTKRTDRLYRYLTYPSSVELRKRWAKSAEVEEVEEVPFPLPNVMLGTSAENQDAFDKRIGALMLSPSVGRFLSVEPMLSPISIQHQPDGRNCLVCGDTDHQLFECHLSEANLLSWVICGGESGPRSRPVHPDWVRSLRDQCEWPSNPIPFMFKQWGAWKPVDWFSEATHGIRSSDGHVTKLEHAPNTIQRAREAPSDWQGIKKMSKKESGNYLDGLIHMERPVF